MQVKELLHLMAEQGASDLHMKVGSPPAFRVDGQLTFYDEQELKSQDIKQAFDEITDDGQQENFARDLELDFAYSVPGLARFRVNAALQRGSITLVFRLINWNVPSMEELGLPELCKTLAMKHNGLVLVVGPTGSGKSTTLAAMIEYLNERESRRIITAEDPIEYLFEDKKCFITQRELGTDTKSFAAALKHALRQDPDVILVGELRDLETITAAVTAAETGHLVLGTLHTTGAAQTVDRIIDIYPAEQQNQIRMQLSMTLQGVLAQTLLSRSDGKGRVLAMETMIGTTAIRNLIREGKTHQLPSQIQTGAGDEMRTFGQSLRQLYLKGLITRETAMAAASDSKELDRMLKDSRSSGGMSSRIRRGKR